MPFRLVCLHRLQPTCIRNTIKATLLSYLLRHPPADTSLSHRLEKARHIKAWPPLSPKRSRRVLQLPRRVLFCIRDTLQDMASSHPLYPSDRPVVDQASCTQSRLRSQPNLTSLTRKTRVALFSLEKRNSIFSRHICPQNMASSTSSPSLCSWTGSLNKVEKSLERKARASERSCAIKRSHIIFRWRCPFTLCVHSFIFCLKGDLKVVFSQSSYIASLQNRKICDVPTTSGLKCLHLVHDLTFFPRYPPRCIKSAGR